MVIPLIWYLINASNNVVSDKPQEFFFFKCVCVCVCVCVCWGWGGGGSIVLYTASQTKLISGGIQSSNLITVL